MIFFEVYELAQLLFHVYLGMFQHESIEALFSNPSSHTMRRSSLIHYHRGSLASFLCFVQRTVRVDWPAVMERFLDLVENDTALLMGRNYIQELYLQLHLMRVYSVRTFTTTVNSNEPVHGGDWRAWKELPSTICITLRVPRAKLRKVTDVPRTEVGTPILHCIVQSSPSFTGKRWQNIFAVMNMSFGSITNVGSLDDDAFSICVSEDTLSWSGRADLVASFMVPTWVMLLEPDTVTVAFRLQSTPYSSRVFSRPLGVEMNIYETALGNKDNV